MRSLKEVLQFHEIERKCFFRAFATCFAYIPLQLSIWKVRHKYYAFVLLSTMWFLVFFFKGTSLISWSHPQTGSKPIPNVLFGLLLISSAYYYQYIMWIYDRTRWENQMNFIPSGWHTVFIFPWKSLLAMFLNMTAWEPACQFCKKHNIAFRWGSLQRNARNIKMFVLLF